MLRKLVLSMHEDQNKYVLEHLIVRLLRSQLVWCIHETRIGTLTVLSITARLHNLAFNAQLPLRGLTIRPRSILL